MASGFPPPLSVFAATNFMGAAFPENDREWYRE